MRQRDKHGLLTIRKTKFGKTRLVPLHPSARRALRQYARQRRAFIGAKFAVIARRTCFTLRSERISPHVARHTAAMKLLQAGVDLSVIALWPGHESIETTQKYLDAHIALKEAALAKTTPVNVRVSRFRPDDRLLKFLNGL